MTPVRLRHPKGVTTIQVDFPVNTVLDLQQQIFAATEIPPSQQDLKAGYPPRPLTLIPELPVDSLGIQNGEPLVVTQRPTAASSATVARQSPFPAPSPVAAMTGLTASRVRESPPMIASSPPGKGPDYVLTSNGYLIHRIVPDDNSCLFSSVALIFEQDIRKAQNIRQFVADAIQKDPVKWNEAILGRSREEYIRTILKPTAWGGAIELSILAQHYSTEIASIDVETGRVDHFTPPPETDSGSRAIVIYSGIHYDATSIAPMLDAPEDFHQTIMSRGTKPGGADEDDEMLQAGKKLADALRAKKAFTNTATFDLKCQRCGKGLKGEKEARAHASETGHVEFGEY
ncbi:OTU-domain-containing protein [Epithele typhae]|uniref:OTU-domain-containing protein n=1 Tax=Epithele typhae TaxID=378194 RepID=UPI0020084CDA|nr:OTU-domain-containing protein [Epithele typhae]KAH9946127.1 OTU-domain-containing protein [Epithele typhae]